ncbi:hypothetical protein FRB96_000739 [Tulasnella sp. 330]|nr:hypothetical protein FRB96_000739 [Tulasnella sp. 330]KAG8879928.1 hypothetical protein FRB97_001282 [Tulasnella sp. 331]
MSCRYLSTPSRTLGTISRQCRSYAKAVPKSAAATVPASQSTPSTFTSSSEALPDAMRSSCLPDTVLEGVTWLKDQKPIVSLPDDQYPPWLWTLLKPQHDPKVSLGKSAPAPQPGTPEAQKALRRENRKNIKAVNFMKAQ